MDLSAYALPILPGKTGAARGFQAELEGRRKGAYGCSEHAREIVRELWFWQETPMGDLFVVYVESPNLRHAFDQLAASRDAFDVWFKQQLVQVTGIDVSTMTPSLPSRLVSRFEAAS